MKTLLLTAFAGVFLIASAAPSGANDRLRAFQTAASDACVADCHENAKACRQQCYNPEEEEQCIVACKSECNASCDKFEEACKKRCESTKG
jgi:hypothetical protein